MARNRTTGTIVFLLNGEQFDLAGGFTYDLGGAQVEEQVGPDGSLSYKETPMAAFIEGQMRDSDALDVQALKRLRGVTVTLQLANGKSAVFVNSRQTGSCQVSTEDGTVDVKFVAERAFEQPA